MNTQNFIHPLSAVKTVMTDDGEKEVMNSWAFASMIWSAVLNANPTAINMAQELFNDSDRFLLLFSQQNESAVREAIAIMALALEEKMSIALE